MVFSLLKPNQDRQGANSFKHWPTNGISVCFCTDKCKVEHMHGMQPLLSTQCPHTHRVYAFYSMATCTIGSNTRHRNAVSARRYTSGCAVDSVDVARAPLSLITFFNYFMSILILSYLPLAVHWYETRAQIELGWIISPTPVRFAFTASRPTPMRRCVSL